MSVLDPHKRKRAQGDAASVETEVASVPEKAAGSMGVGSADAGPKGAGSAGVGSTGAGPKDAGSADASSKGEDSKGAGNKQGRRIRIARRVTIAACFVAVIASLAIDSGIGTPCAFGINEFALLCPLGGLEAMLASRTFIPQAAISLAIVVVFTLIFGRAWCAWGCPSPVIRRFFHPKSGSTTPTTPTTPHGLLPALKSIAGDTRSWVLVCVLVAAFVAGFPLFCLFCPIGLTFGTVSSLWHLIVDKQVTLSCVVFPLVLVIELVICRRWCMNLCPIAGLLNIFGHAAKLFRPRVRKETCLRCNGASCRVCEEVCEEEISLHEVDSVMQLAKCTRCGECVRMCPSSSISIKAAPGKPL